MSIKITYKNNKVTTLDFYEFFKIVKKLRQNGKKIDNVKGIYIYIANAQNYELPKYLSDTFPDVEEFTLNRGNIVFSEGCLANMKKLENLTLRVDSLASLDFAGIIRENIKILRVATREVKENDFNGFTNLEELGIVKSKEITLKGDCFSSLKKLKRLTISSSTALNFTDSQIKSNTIGYLNLCAPIAHFNAQAQTPFIQCATLEKLSVNLDEHSLKLHKIIHTCFNLENLKEFTYYTGNFDKELLKKMKFIKILCLVDDNTLTDEDVKDLNCEELILTSNQNVTPKAASKFKKFCSESVSYNQHKTYL